MAMHVPKIMTLNKKKPHCACKVRVMRLFSLTMNKFTRGSFVCKPRWSQDTLTCKKKIYIYIYIYLACKYTHTKLTYFDHPDLIIIRV